MEPAEDTSLEAAIGWLVQTILATLLIDKLEEWIRRVGLADDVKKLKSEIRRVGMVVSVVKGREIGNEPLAESLALLKELLYDADDVVDDLDYYRLQQQVESEGVTADDPEGVHAAEQVDDTSRGDADIPNSSVGKLRSEAWEHFKIIVRENAKPVKAECKYCLTKVKCGTVNGTSGMRNHLKICKTKPGASDQPPNPSSTGDATANATPIVVGNPSSRKRRRTDEESAQVTTANTHTPCDKAELSNRIKKITSQLQDIRGEVSEVLKLHGSDSATNSNHYGSTTSDQYLRTSSLVPREVYGRAAEKKSIIKLMTENKSDGVTVLPIVGIAGIGKTALAQLVYNDLDVESQFDHRIWVWVSHDFDEVRLIREMLDYVSREGHEGSPQKVERSEGISSFAKLQEILKEHMEFPSKRFLLIFDDVWDNMDDYQWNKLLAPLKSSRAKGNVILVTTRSFSVAQRTGTVKSIKLGALANKDILLLCEAYAFGDDNYEGHESLSIVVRQIAEKLEGNPLAAETAGGLLREHLTIEHWSSILMNEDWKSLQLSRGIMPALKLSYDQLPYHLQQCFSCSSIFPYSYQFLGDDLVHIWISQGFVKCDHSSKRLEEIGQYYLTDLVNLGFFQQVEEEEESSLGSQIRYAMCGLMHDFAMIVSRTECATIDGLQCNKMLPTVQHLSIVTYSAYSKDQHGNIPRNKNFEEKLRNTVTSVGNLRTLVLIGQYEYFFFQLFQDIFRKAHNLRLLQMSATSADFNSLMCSLVNAAHLRYLKVKADEKDWTLPQVLSKCCHLQVLDVGSYTDPTIPDGINNLVSLRHLGAKKGVCSSIASNVSVTSLRTLHLENCGKWQILPSLERLPFLTKLKLSNMRKVLEVSVPSLEELVLVKMPKLERCSCTSVGHLNSSLRALQIEKCHALKVFDLFENGHKFKIEQKSWLPGLRKLILRDCPHLEVLNPLPPSTACSELLIGGVSMLPRMKGSSSKTLTIGSFLEYPHEYEAQDFDESSDKLMTLDDQTLAFYNLGSLQLMMIVGCPNLTSISFEGFSQLVSLKRLEIHRCNNLLSSHVLPERTCKAFPSLESLTIWSCGIAGKWLPLILRHAPKLEELILHDCPHITTLLSIEEEENSLSNLTAREDSSSGNPDDALTGLAQDRLLRIPLNPISSLKKIRVLGSPYLTFNSLEGLSGFTSLEQLYIGRCHQDGNDDQANGRRLFPQSLGELEIAGYFQETLQPCFPRNRTCLKKLIVRESTSLKSLQLHSCTALEELVIGRCKWLTTLEGLQYLGSLRRLTVFKCPVLHPYLESLSRVAYELFPRLETLEIDDPSVLTTSFCKHLTSLLRLRLNSLVLTCEQERALVLLKSLQELEFSFCSDLVVLPAGLHTLPSLKTLKIELCPGISRLPETGLPLSLEELVVTLCRKELSDQCMLLATSKLNVRTQSNITDPSSDSTLLSYLVAPPACGLPDSFWDHFLHSKPL